MKRAYETDDDESYQEEDSDEEQECSFGGQPSLPSMDEYQEELEANSVRSDDRPYLLPSSSTTTETEPFDYHPKGKQVDPLATGSLVADISPHGATLGTLEYNLRHAIERRDERRMAACLTEFFRHFVLLNRPIRRFVPPNLERQRQLEMVFSIGPFSTPAALGMHQRLLVMLMGIAVRQIGVATPTIISFLLDTWKLYERVLFHRPTMALATLLKMGATLCHCKKDASVAYTRHLFQDTSKMREWRSDVLRNPDVVGMYIPSADQAHQVRKILLCNKVYFDTRLRLRRYQTVCIGNPHPEYMCQGGCMQRPQVLALVDAIKDTLSTGPDVTAVVQDVEDIMIYLGSHVNNVYDRERFEDLQVDLQLFLYLFQRVLLHEEGSGPDSLMRTVVGIVGGAPNHVTEEYAHRMWNFRPDMVHLVKYGVQGEPLLKSGRKPKRKALSSNDLVDTFQPEIVPKLYEWAPPSIVRDEDNILREHEASEIQSHPATSTLRFLFSLYRLQHMWTKCLSSNLAVHRDAKERVVLDREFFDVTQPTRLLYQCTATGVCAAEVVLQGSAAMDLEVSETSFAKKRRDERIATHDAAEAEIFADHLGRLEHARAKGAIKAVLVGPWSLHDHSKLEKQVAQHQQLKEALGVQPDVVVVKKMMLLDFSAVVGDAYPLVLGRTYAWVVYIPSLGHHTGHHVVMTIDRLKRLARQDTHLAQSTKLILNPMHVVRLLAVMKRTCEEYCNWKVGDNYVSFTVDTDDADIVLRNVRIHTITDTLLNQCPDYRFTNDATTTTTSTILQTIMEKCRTSSQYAGVNVELAHCESILSQLSSTALRLE